LRFDGGQAQFISVRRRAGNLQRNGVDDGCTARIDKDFRFFPRYARRSLTGATRSLHRARGDGFRRRKFRLRACAADVTSRKFGLFRPRSARSNPSVESRTTVAPIFQLSGQRNRVRRRLPGRALDAIPPENLFTHSSGFKFVCFLNRLASLADAGPICLSSRQSFTFIHRLAPLL